MKKRVFIPFITLLLTVLVGCSSGSFFAIDAKENNSPNKFSMEYEKFSGHKQTKIKVSENETVTIDADIVTNSGELDISVERNNDDDDVFSADDVETSAFEIVLDKEGTYILRVDGDKHKGSYNFTW
ncbi:MAG: hypothetical protein RR048_02535 [Oscillospiraceae bacterium]